MGTSTASQPRVTANRLHAEGGANVFKSPCKSRCACWSNVRRAGLGRVENDF